MKIQHIHPIYTNDVKKLQALEKRFNRVFIDIVRKRQQKKL